MSEHWRLHTELAGTDNKTKAQKRWCLVGTQSTRQILRCTWPTQRKNKEKIWTRLGVVNQIQRSLIVSPNKVCTIALPELDGNGRK